MGYITIIVLAVSIIQFVVKHSIVVVRDVKYLKFFFWCFQAITEAADCAKMVDFKPMVRFKAVKSFMVEDCK